MRNSLAVRNGVALKLGSSETLRPSATRLPEKTERFRLPTLTSRPSAVASCFSTVGRKVFAFTKILIATTTTTRRAASASRTFIQRFTGTPQRNGFEYLLGEKYMTSAGAINSG